MSRSGNNLRESSASSRVEQKSTPILWADLQENDLVRAVGNILKVAWAIKLPRATRRWRELTVYGLRQPSSRTPWEYKSVLASHKIVFELHCWFSFAFVTDSASKVCLSLLISVGWSSLETNDLCEVFLVGITFHLRRYEIRNNDLHINCIGWKFITDCRRSSGVSTETHIYNC